MHDETNPDRTDLPLGVLDQIDRICDRFEAAWERGERPRIEDRLGEIAESYRPSLLRDLLAAEVAARRRRDERPDPGAYRDRFPVDVDAVDAAFAAPPGRRAPGRAPVTAQGSLLVGLLGFQTGLIDQSRLVEALREWIGDKARPLADILAGQGAIDEPRRALLEALVAESLKQHGGDVARSLASIPAGASTRERLARLADTDLDATMDQVGAGVTEPTADEFHLAAGYSVGGGAADGQRFRVLRPHAKGGLGAVFVALDTELHREVALKQILDQHADDPTSRSRFLAEAEITGGLEHPGIVPVYGLGTYGDGRPYYAMRFIKGDSLKEAIDAFHADSTLKQEPGRRSLELRRLLRRFTDVCNAIDYAHSRGVLHRDIKPGNIIVGRHGETLVVDWGLAKAVGRGGAGETGGERPLSPSSASGLAETLPGSALGTPAFMSPEQAAGDLDRLGPRSDVYSLGATLYCLLAGRSPFEQAELGALMRAVRAGDFSPPRAIDPSIDRAPEAICRKAMSPRPEDRYESARALAEDLDRWMADEPVAAYRDPLAARLGRWARRHKPAVAGTAALLITMVIALGVSTLLIGREQRRTRDAYHAEATQRRRADARSRLARQAVDEMYTQVAERWLADQPRMEPVQREFLEKARVIYEELAAEDESDPAVRREVLAAHRRVGDIQLRLGHLDLAEKDYRRALALADEPVSRASAEPTHLLDEAYARGRLADVLIKTGRLPEAERELEREIDELSKLAREAPSRPEIAGALAVAYDRRGYLMRLTGRWSGAEQSYRLAVDSLDAGENSGHPAPGGRRTRAGILANFAQALHRVGRLDESIRSLEQAAALYESQIAVPPGSPVDRSELASCLVSLGFGLSERGELSQAEGQFRRGIDLLRRLSDDFPSVPDYRRRLGSAYNNLAIVLGRSNRRSQTEDAYRQALELAEALYTQSPGVPDHRADLIRNLGNFGNFLQDIGKHEEAEVDFRRAIAMSERLASDFPAVPEYRTNFLALNRYNLADALRSNGRGEEAEALYRRVLETMESTSGDASGVVLARLIRAGALGHLGGFRLDRREYADAARLLERAVAEGQAAAKLAPGSFDALQVIVVHGSGLSRARFGLGDRRGAAAAASETAPLAVQLARQAGGPEQFIETARILAHCAAVALEPSTKRDYTEHAVESLRGAIERGARDPRVLSQDPDLVGFTSLPEVRLLLMDLAMPADPFAH